MVRDEILENFSELLDIMRKLREKCPWNREQTTLSLRTLTIEEVYELSDAILNNSKDDLLKELGDVLFHVIFYAQIAQEQLGFDIGDVIARSCKKMKYRHPHVFDDLKQDNHKGQDLNKESDLQTSENDAVLTKDDIANTWEMRKLKEEGGNKRILSGVPISLPSILKAYAMQEKAQGVGFEWKDKREVWGKVREEIEEFEEEIDNMQGMENEFGDLLFSMVNAARMYGINPDTALERSCEKFRKRFTYIEEQTIRKGQHLQNLTLGEMDKLWNEAKRIEKTQSLRNTNNDKIN